MKTTMAANEQTTFRNKIVSLYFCFSFVRKWKWRKSYYMCATRVAGRDDSSRKNAEEIPRISSHRVNLFIFIFCLRLLPAFAVIIVAFNVTLDTENFRAQTRTAARNACECVSIEFHCIWLSHPLHEHKQTRENEKCYKWRVRWKWIKHLRLTCVCRVQNKWKNIKTEIMFCHHFNVKLLYVGCRRHECGRQKQAILHMLNTNYSNCRLQTISVYIFQLHFELNTELSIQDVRNVLNYFTHFKTRTASCIRWHAPN